MLRKQRHWIQYDNENCLIKTTVRTLNNNVWMWLVLLGLLVGLASCQNCRGKEYRLRTCEKLCEGKNNCTLRAALLLPANTTYDASLAVVQPVVELAMQHPDVKAAFPSWINVEWQSYDVTDCDAAYAVISAIDALNDCAHVFFGPACDFALASVARITKFLGNTGIPVLTTGGFTFDFVQPKQACDDEYYTLVRTGPLGFKDISYFIISLMENFHWRQLLLITEPDAQQSVAGKNTCHLMMKTLANFLKKENLMYIPWDTNSDGGKNETENLIHYLGDYKLTNSPDSLERFRINIAPNASDGNVKRALFYSPTRRTAKCDPKYSAVIKVGTHSGEI